MTTIDGLRERLESLHEEHGQRHAELTVAISDLRGDVVQLQQYLRGNGRVTVVVEKNRLRFAGSLSLKALGLFGTTSTGGVVYLVGKALGQW